MPITELLYVGTAAGLAIYHVDRTGALQRAGHVLASAAVRAVVATDALTLLVATEEPQAWQSFDGGAHWLEGGTPPEPIGLLVATVHGPAPLAYPRLSGATAYARPQGKPTVLLGAGAGGTQIFRSFDDGIHWEAAQPIEQAAGSVTALAPSVAQRKAVWAGTSAGVLLHSADAGLHWRVVAQEPTAIRCLAVVRA